MDSYSTPSGASVSSATEPFGEIRLTEQIAEDRHLDDLPLRDAVFGDGVVLVERRRGEVDLHLVDAGITTRLGRYANAAQAWRALDDVDDVAPPRRRWFRR